MPVLSATVPLSGLEAFAELPVTRFSSRADSRASLGSAGRRLPPRGCGWAGSCYQGSTASHGWAVAPGPLDGSAHRYSGLVATQVSQA